MKNRRQLSSKGSKRMFSKHASYTHQKNLQIKALPMRGGFRL